MTQERGASHIIIKQQMLKPSSYTVCCIRRYSNHNSAGCTPALT